MENVTFKGRSPICPTCGTVLRITAISAEAIVTRGGTTRPHFIRYACLTCPFSRVLDISTSAWTDSFDGPWAIHAEGVFTAKDQQGAPMLHRHFKVD